MQSPRTDSKRGNTKRKQTLLSLLDALNELTKDDDFGRDSTLDPRFEDDRDVPTVDERLQKVGAELFGKFERRIIDLDKQLRNFAHAARQLGSSVGILSSAYLLRERLAQILYLFRENAAYLFPRKISHQDSTTHVNNLPWRQSRRARMKAPPNVRTPIVLETLDPEDFPDQVDKFAEDITIFLECLNEFPEFTDEAVNASIMAFQGDLKYWASCLNQYRGQFRYPAVQRYLHDLSSELGDHIDSITSSLSLFIEVGVPTIRFAQKHGATNLLNLSTVATFFSAVTATTMQFSVTDTSDVAANAVNAFWFTSLVFSIAAAVNSLLGLTWKQAMYRSPRHLVPWWVSMWIRRSPLMFLVLSVACFSAGLVVFAYSSGQHYVTATITTVFSAFSSFGLTAVSAWFISERYVFNRHKGKKWLADVLDDASEQFVSIPGVRWMATVLPARSKDAIIWSGRTLRQALMKIAHVGSTTMDTLANRSQSSMGRSDATIPEDAYHPTIYSTEPLSAGTTFVDTVRFSGSGGDRPPDSPIIASETQNIDEPALPGLSGRIRFANLVRNVIMIHRTTGFGMSPSSSSPAPDEPPRLNVDHVVMPRSSRVSGLVPKLRNMVPTQDIAAHTALVRHIQFSPDGKFLATSSWDRTSVIFRVGDPFTSHRVLLHPTGFIGQVAWSPCGNMIMTKLPRAVKLWTQDGVCRKTIERHRHVQSIAWLPGSEAFLSVEESEIVRMDINGKVIDTYHFDRMHLHDVAITSDCERIFTVGTMVKSADGFQPSKSRNEKQIIAFNLDRKELENRVPVLHDIRDITISRNDQVVLVSYENKAPPQLWKVEMVKKPYEPTSLVARLNLRHTYMPKIPVDFAGPSYFGGKDDQLILCAGKAGDVHIWDRESGALLHHVGAQVVGGDLTSVAWNHAADPFMFATGSHDGAVRIWTTASPSFQTPPYPEVHVSTPTTSEARTRSPSPYPPDRRSPSPFSPPSPDPRSPSPGLFPPDPDYRLESPASLNRSNLRVELRDMPVEPEAYRPRVTFLS